jgi:alpha-tubulin suppressor-like RCC1 family protein
MCVAALFAAIMVLLIAVERTDAQDLEAWAWGQNEYGQLGDGTNTNRNAPVQVRGLSGVQDIDAGFFGHSLALKSDGTVWALGQNDYGQLGDGTTTQRNVPVKVRRLSGVQDIDGGYRHSLALKSDGTVWAWGRNKYGQLGVAGTTQRNFPVQVSGLSGVRAIGAGHSHSLAVTS